jgi:hypothetical protein
LRGLYTTPIFTTRKRAESRWAYYIQNWRGIRSSGSGVCTNQARWVTGVPGCKAISRSALGVKPGNPPAVRLVDGEACPAISRMMMPDALPPTLQLIFFMFVCAHHGLCLSSTSNSSGVTTSGLTVCWASCCCARPPDQKRSHR